MVDPRVVCSSISFRRRPLGAALETIADQGFQGFDLGALPGVCDHVPFDLTNEAVAQVADQVNASPLRTVSINGDIGDLNRILSDAEQESRWQHLHRLLQLCVATHCPALVLPNGSLGHEPIDTFDNDIRVVAAQLAEASSRAQQRGVALWVEAQHSGRLCYDLAHARQLVALLPDDIGVVLDFSHVVAIGDDLQEFVDTLGDAIVHVHLRDARPGNINVSVGRGEVDFAAGIAALRAIGYRGDYSLELETADVTEDQRPSVARSAGEYISTLI